VPYWLGSSKGRGEEPAPIRMVPGWGFRAEPVEAAPPNPRPMSRGGRWSASVCETVATISLDLDTGVSPD